MATNSYEQLQKYAELLNAKVLLDASEIKAQVDKNISLHWAANKEDIAVLINGDILISDPSSPSLYECKTYFKTHGLTQGEVYFTTLAVVKELRERAADVSMVTANEDKTIGEKQLMDLIHLAIEQNASDIHMFIGRTRCKIHFRVDGLLVPITDWPAEQGIRIHNVAYNFVAQDKSDNFNRTKPQDTSFTLHLQGKGDVRIRSSNIPTNNGGCNIVYRILSIGQKDVVSIEKLGYTKAQEELLSEIKYLSSGLVLFCGETGSGKTTSLASVLAGIDARRKVYSIEDPVEKLVPNVIQIPVDTKDKSRSFAYYLRALLRQDPNVIMVGEIRDLETAQVAMQSALTGHLILSTLHTRYAVDSVLRLSEFGMSPKILATPNLLKLIVAQELHPKLCSLCRRPLMTEEKQQLLGLYNKSEMEEMFTVPLKKDINPDCPVCGGKGIAGRKVYAEIVKVDQRAHDFIADVDIKGWRSHLQECGFVTLNERVRNAIRCGEIDALGVTRDPIEVAAYSYREQVRVDPGFNSIDQKMQFFNAQNNSQEKINSRLNSASILRR